VTDGGNIARGFYFTNFALLPRLRQCLPVAGAFLGGRVDSGFVYFGRHHAGPRKRGLFTMLRECSFHYVDSDNLTGTPDTQLTAIFVLSDNRWGDRSGMPVTTLICPACLIPIQKRVANYAPQRTRELQHRNWRRGLNDLETTGSYSPESQITHARICAVALKRHQLTVK
jgi:hypothetical protein